MNLEQRMEHALKTTSAGNLLDAHLRRGPEYAKPFLEGLACGMAHTADAPVTAAARVLASMQAERQP